jgi:hypothetical protein
LICEGAGANSTIQPIKLSTFLELSINLPPCYTG